MQAGIIRTFFRTLLSLAPTGVSLPERLKTREPNETIVYVMPNASLFDYLLMKELAHKLDLPPPESANDVTLLRLSKKPAFRHRHECRKLADIVSRGGSILLFLGKSGLFSRSLRWNVLIWEELIRAHRKEKGRVLFQPVSIMWGRRPDRIKKDLHDILFGDTSNPNLLRKLFISLRNPKEIHIRFGAPIDLARFLAETTDGKEELHAKKLRRLLSVHLYRERKLVAGPPVRDRERIIRALLKDPDLQSLVRAVARREKKSEPETWRRADSILRELVSDYSPAVAAISYRVFKWLWAKLYDDLWVDREGIERLKEIVKIHPTILVPSHKSHMDYMLLSGLFYENDMLPPMIIAGNNLSFWPMGLIFRKNGAIFIRRQMAGDLLYARLLGLYQRLLIRMGYTQEFFIEGGRTRTGKLAFPKHGLLAMQVDAFLSGASKDLFVAPIAISYEKIPEEASYRAELTGQKKEKENFFAVIKSRKLLSRSHGAAYVRFGKPVSCAQFFGTNSEKDITTKDRKAKTFELAKEVVRSIASDTVVTLSALGAVALLAQKDHEILESTLTARLRLFQDYLLERGFPLSPSLSAGPIDTNVLVRFFREHEWIDFKENTTTDRLLSMREDKRVPLDFYKNMVLHYFLPASIAAVSLEHGADEERRLDFVTLLQEVFSHEFLLVPSPDGRAFLSFSERWFDKARQPWARSVFAALIQNYLEAYDWAAEAALKLEIRKLPLDDDLVRRGLELGYQLLAEGKISRREAVTSANLRSAFGFFNEKDLLNDSAKAESWHQRLKCLTGPKLP